MWLFNRTQILNLFTAVRSEDKVDGGCVEVRLLSVGFHCDTDFLVRFCINCLFPSAFLVDCVPGACNRHYPDQTGGWDDDVVVVEI